ncbi:MAG: hypothetical protein LIQ30_04545 [Planctomycetes bacterium]|nr:hypothetical protein [Planctomycetota bacterium]MCD7896651.1 hypothetical protein [Planctomycetaceae bacterium]
MAKLFMTLGDKGGIGKSFIPALMAQYILDNLTDYKPVCIDLDCKNCTFSRYEGLGVDLIDVRTDGDIDRSKFDLLINRIMSAKDNEIVITDVGGNVYVPMTDYLKVNEIFELLTSFGTEIVLHVPFVGGGDLFPTLQTLDELVENTPSDLPVSVWINQKNGRVEYKGKCFEESERFYDYQCRIKAITYIPLWRPDMQINVAEMLEDAVTFDQALRMDTFDLVSKQRLTMAKRYLYSAIEKSGVCL